MKIKKGTLLQVKHSRSGNWKGIATKNFDTEKEEWYPIKLAEERVDGLNTSWFKGDDMPARNCLCKIKLAEKEPLK